MPERRGMSGGFNQPPTPSGNSYLFGLPEDPNQPGTSHTPQATRHRFFVIEESIPLEECGTAEEREINQDQLWMDLEKGEENERAAKENQKMLRQADRLDQREKVFIERAVGLVDSEGIQVKDPEDIRRAAEVVLVNKNRKEVTYATKAILNKNAKIAKDFLAVLEDLNDP